MSINQILTTVLTITDYPEKDRQSFSNELLSMAGQKAMLLFFQDLPEEKQKEIKEQLENEHQEKIEEQYKTYLNEEAFKKHFVQEVDAIMGEYIEEVASDLTDEQKKQLEAFLKPLSTTTDTE